MKYLKTYFLLIFFFNYDIFSQNINEKIVFTSSNPYTFEEIISKSKNPKQIVYGKLVIPFDSLNPEKKVSTSYRSSRK